MNRVIKSTWLHSCDDIEEFLIDPGQSVCAHLADSITEVCEKSEEISLVDQAKAEANAIITSAYAEAEAIRDAAYREGLESGLQQVEAQKQELIEQFDKLNTDADAKLEEYWTLTEPEMLKLAVEIAEKIVRKHIDEHEDFVMNTVKGGIRQLREKQDLKVHVNPADYDFMRAHKEDIIASSDGIRTVEIVDDRRVDQGGTLIDSGSGHLDARISTQFKEIEKALTEAADYGKRDCSADS